MLTNNKYAAEAQECLNASEGDIRYEGQKEQLINKAQIQASLAIAFELAQLNERLDAVTNREGYALMTINV